MKCNFNIPILDSELNEIENATIIIEGTGQESSFCHVLDENFPHNQIKDALYKIKVQHPIFETQERNVEIKNKVCSEPFYLGKSGVKYLKRKDILFPLDYDKTIIGVIFNTAYFNAGIRLEDIISFCNQYGVVLDY
jgi:hypothetical protein